MPQHTVSPTALFDLGRAWIGVQILRKRIPLFAEWNLTFRCNLRCRYCGACDAPRDELACGEILRGLDQLWTLGTRWITFGGGEPLLRDDIKEILQYAAAKGFHVFLSTNGSLLPKKQDVLEWVDHVNISLDGAKAVHDAVRGAGAFDRALEAVQLCRQRGTGVSLACVLSSENLGSVVECIEIARENACTIQFQPATAWLDSSTRANPLAPAPEAYRETIRQIIALKKSGAPIRNSVPGLQHLLNWPAPARIWCSAARLTLSIEPDGALLACHQAQVGSFLAGKEPGGEIADQYRQARAPKNCRQCWCAPMVELALVFSLRPGAILNAFRTM
jgi:MoaA/NifB/PqqE/SkfB family radical SAM enzyme